MRNFTLLHLAVAACRSKDQLPLIEYLLNQNVDMNIADADGFFAVHYIEYPEVLWKFYDKNNQSIHKAIRNTHETLRMVLERKKQSQLILNDKKRLANINACLRDLNFYDQKEQKTNIENN